MRSDAIFELLPSQCFLVWVTLRVRDLGLVNIASLPFVNNAFGERVRWIAILALSNISNDKYYEVTRQDLLFGC